MTTGDFRHELLLVLNYGDPAALKRLVQMRFPNEAQAFMSMADNAVEEAFHLVRKETPGVRPELVEESRSWLSSRERG